MPAKSQSQPHHPSAPGEIALDVSKEGGRAVLTVALSGAVTAARARKLAEEVGRRVDAIGGRPFGLLFDLRKVASFDDAAGPVLQKIEMDAAAKGLEAVAHLVAQEELAKQADAEVKAVGGAKMIGNFTDERRARAFAAGTTTKG